MAVSALQVVLALTRPADSALKGFFRDHPHLGQQDRAFVAELVFAVLRNLRLLEHLCGEPTPRRLALTALTTYFGFSIRELSSLLVAGDEAWLAQARSTDRAQLPAGVRLSLPDWLYQRLAQHYPPQELEKLARSFLQPAPLDLRVNGLLGTREDVLNEFKRDGIAAEPTHYSPLGVRLDTKPALQRHPLFLNGKVEVQDEGSQLLAYLVAPRRREMVVDFCAGAGGKTLALGALMHSRRKSLCLRHLGKAPQPSQTSPEALGAIERSSAAAAIRIGHARKAPGIQDRSGVDRRAVQRVRDPATQSGSQMAAASRSGSPDGFQAACYPQIRGTLGQARRAAGLCHLQCSSRGERSNRGAISAGGRGVSHDSLRRNSAAPGNPIGHRRILACLSPQPWHGWFFRRGHRTPAKSIDRCSHAFRCAHSYGLC